MVNNAQELLNKAEELGHTFYRICTKTKLVSAIKTIDLIQILIQRQKQLRELGVKRNVALVNSMKIAGDAWLKSKYCYAISGAKAHIIEVVVILFPTEYKQCITAYMNSNIKNKTT